MSTEIDRGKRWREDQIQLGLTYIAQHGGKCRQASEAMVEDGHERVAPSTLHAWKNDPKHADRIKELRQVVLDEYKQEAGLYFADMRRQLLEEAGELRKELTAKRGKISPDAIPRGLKELLFAAASASDQTQRLQGEPFVVEHNINLTLVQKAIAQLEDELGEPHKPPVIEHRRLDD